MESEWKVYTGDREEKFYDIKLYSGEVVLECYPGRCSWSSPSGLTYKDCEIASVRESVDGLFASVAE